MAGELALSQIGQIAVPVQDLNRAVRFYRDILRIPFLFQAPNLAFFDCAGVRLMLDSAAEAEFRHPSSILYFKVDEINNAFTTLSERGVDFRGEPHLIAKMPDYELWMAFFDDGEGNVHALMCEVR